MAARWQDLLQFGHAEEKSSGDNRFSLPVALKIELFLSSFEPALYKCRGSESHGASAAGRELYTKLKLSWTDLNFTIV